MTKPTPSVFVGDSEALVKSPELPKTPWKSIITIGVLTVCTCLQFALFSASLWTYLTTLDSRTHESFLGWIISTYSCAQIICAPLLGYLSNRLRNVRLLIGLCIFLQIIGNLMYLSAQLLDADHKWFILGARFVAGVGASNLSLLKAYASTASTPEDRPRAISICTCGIALGLSLGPAFQYTFVPLGYPGWLAVGKIYVNMYTAPALFGIFINLTAMALLVFLFDEKYAGLAKEVDDDADLVLPKPDRLALFASYVARYAHMFNFSNVEAMAPFVMTLFAWTATQTVTYMSIAQAGVSLVEFLWYGIFFVFNLDKRVNFRIICIFGFFGLGCFYLITFPYPFLPGSLLTYTDQDIYLFKTNLTAVEPVGCNVDRLQWCFYTKPANVYLFFTAFVLIMGSCFCIVNISSNTLFSEILGPRRQGTQHGISQMIGGFARLTAPIATTHLYEKFGPPWAWSLCVMTMMGTAILWLFCYRRLVPLRIPSAHSDKLSDSETSQ